MSTEEYERNKKLAYISFMMNLAGGVGGLMIGRGMGYRGWSGVLFFMGGLTITTFAVRQLYLKPKGWDKSWSSAENIGNYQSGN